MRYSNSNDYLYHYGVKGMRWGVRRARRQNAKVDKSFKKWNENAQKRENSSGCLNAISSCCFIVFGTSTPSRRHSRGATFSWEI